MSHEPDRIGLGGGCHWCTEAVFQSLVGVGQVEQGWLAPTCDPDNFSEGVIVHFDASHIDLATLVAVHLHTHSCTSMHALRSRYRSAIYAASAAQEVEAQGAVAQLGPDFAEPIITRVLRLHAFRANDPRYVDYYRSDPERPFCQTFIAPKLRLVRRRFGAQAKEDESAREPK